MKIAICLSGQMRTAVEAEPNIKRFIGDLLPNCDFFIHTWDINQQKSYGLINGKVPTFRKHTPLKPKEVEDVTQEDIDRYSALYNPKVIFVDNFKMFHDKVVRARTAYQPPLFYSWRMSVLYCVRYALEHNVQYDVVVKLRPDIVFPESRRLITEIDNYLTDTSAFYCNNGGVEGNFDDVFWISSQKTMLLLSTYGDPYISMKSSISMKDFIEMNKVDLKPMIGYGYAPLRPETAHFNVLTEFSELFYYDQYWYSSKEPFYWAGEHK